ncbi:hypothetical protein POM88_001605 [Heracleum sosnowskyi]|uniref:Uncharacterized protein n=1 Tax=Heracleum sosnowskyi TaxID=360622 RepID=A0AAD8N547_9APIA|nr:hypothetical protein POM88_001605 [Heracleum sosnowskyi]
MDALMEDIGNEYFNILLWNSLLQDLERDGFGNITTCKMHDLVHDLGQELSKHHSITLEAVQELNHISKSIYLRLNTGVSNIKPKILKKNFERVPVLYTKARILGDVLPYFKHLTVLVLNTNEDIELPRSLSKMKTLGELKHLRGKLELYGLGDIYSVDEASDASLCTKSNIERLKLEWNKNEDEVENIEYNDEEVMKGFKPHANLKELTVVHFEGEKFASWITMMINLVKITLKSCNRCKKIPPLGHLPKLVEVEINGMIIAKVIGSDICGGQGRGSIELSESGAEKTVTTLYPSLTKLILRGLPRVEEWIEPVMCKDGEDQGNMLVFPKLEVLEIISCSKLTKIPSSCFPSLKKLEIKDLDSSVILETMSKSPSSLVNLRLLNIKNGGRGTSSIIKDLLSLTSLELNNCTGLSCLTIGTALEKLKVSNCPGLTNIGVLEKAGALRHLMIVRCPKYVVFSQSLSSTLVKLKLGPSSEELDEFPWPFLCDFIS